MTQPMPASMENCRCTESPIRLTLPAKEAIEKAINDNYGNNRLNSQAVMEMLSAEFSIERIQYVLANTVQYKGLGRAHQPSQSGVGADRAGRAEP